MPTAQEVIDKVGSEMWEKMCRTGWLDCITVTAREDGQTEIPQRDIDIALRAAQGDQIGEWEWD